MEEEKMVLTNLQTLGEKSQSGGQVSAEYFQLSGPSEVVSSVSFVETESSRSVPETVYVAEALPEGYTMAFEESGQQYVTIIQDHHTFAIPLAEYQAMQQSGEATITIQTQPDDNVQNDFFGGAQIVSIPSTSTILSEQSSATAKKQDIIWEPHTSLQQDQILHIQEQPSIQMLTLQQGSGQNKLPPNKRLLSQSQYQQQLGVTSASPLADPKNIQLPHSSKPLLVQNGNLLEKINVSGVSDLDSRHFKAIQVDNWGIFLLGRFFSFYQKKEQCDLILRFPTKNAQISVHKLVLNSCTDYFLKCERNGQIFNGALDMPEEFMPDAVAAIIRFLYTGRLDVKSGMFSNIYKVASKLHLFVLMRLMDAQTGNSSEEILSKNLKRRHSNDPVSQIKKIKKLERKFTVEGKRQKLSLAKQEELKKNLIPGKKLPIWRRKVPDFCSNETAVLPSSKSPTTTKFSGTALHKTIENSKSSPKLSSPAQIKAYGKVTDSSPKAKLLPKQLTEFQSNLTFEKIRDTGRKNSSKPGSDEPIKDMTVDEIKAFMDEQRKRFAELGENIDDDDYYDNDAEMDYGDDPGDDDETINISIVEPLVLKPILKTPQMQESVPNKSVRFSMSNDESYFSNERSKSQKTGSAVVNTDTETKTISPALPETSASSESELQTDDNTEIEPKEKKSSNIDSLSTSQPDMSLITEILRQRPELLKQNGAVRVKVKTVNANGKSVIKTFSLKPQNPPATKSATRSFSKAQVAPVPTPGVRETPKVCYTGKRGRPKKVKPGEVDPHEREREEIDQRRKASQGRSAQKLTPSRNLRRLNYDTSATNLTLDNFSEQENMNGTHTPENSDNLENSETKLGAKPGTNLPNSVKELSKDWDDEEEED